MTRPLPRPARQRGFSFIEISVALVLLGMLSAMAAQIIPAMRRSSLNEQTLRNLGHVQNSLQAFAAIHGRLPCADTNGDGLENATPSCATVGAVPYLTLGHVQPLVNAEGFALRYGLYHRGGGSLRTTALLGSKGETYRPAIAGGSPVALSDKAFTESNRRLDFCQGLRAGLDAGFNDSYLFVETPGGNRKHLAYVLVDPGVGNMDLLGDRFDGRNGTANTSRPGFDHPSRAESLLYDDRVIAVYFDTLWEHMGCSGNMSAAGRAHPNVETMMALVKQSSADYSAQLAIAVDAAYADNFAAGAGVASATAGLLAAGAAIPTDIASAINTAGATSGAAVSAGIALGLNTANLALAIANQVLTVECHRDFQDFQSRFNTLVSTKLDPLYLSIQSNVSRSMAKVYDDE
jgi:prepilin-type N-terminal cleavage/methylation domain-containing protein